MEENIAEYVLRADESIFISYIDIVDRGQLNWKRNLLHLFLIDAVYNGRFSNASYKEMVLMQRLQKLTLRMGGDNTLESHRTENGFSIALKKMAIKTARSFFWKRAQQNYSESFENQNFL